MDLPEVTRALRDLAVRPAYREQAERNLTAWWTAPRYAAFRPQLERLAERRQWNLLLDSFYRTIPFGTGGRRGPVGIGPNRMNQDTVLSSVQGHIDWLRRRFGNARLRIVVAFDVRVFHDLRRLYDPAVPNPLLGLTSRDLARMACGVYAAAGVEVYTVTGDDDFFLSTPELSFAIRHLGAHGGLNISASHNHPDDNGAKFYMPTGGQPVPPDDEELATAVEAVTDVPAADFDEALRNGRVRWWDAASHAAYLEANLAQALDPTARGARLVYTPLHGTGLHTVGDLLPRAGFELHIVAAQAQPDGTFPGVKFRIPNPEVPESMEQLRGEAQRLAADAGVATDPDADRLGVVIADGGTWRPLDGNEIAVLLAAYIIETRRALGTLPARGFLVRTAVTTSLLTRMAQANGLQIVDDLLVGFKYVGQVLDAIETHGRYGDVRATLADFLFAAEESNGVQVTPAVRDKDAAGGALLLAELCARLAQHGQTLAGYLEDVYRRYGYAANAGYSIVMEGVAGLERRGQMMSALRRDPPTLAEGAPLRVLDHWDESAFGPIRSETDRSARNFVQLEYAGSLRMAVRPSGTEPKIKLYVERVFDPQPEWRAGGLAAARREMDAAVRETTLSVVDRLLRLVGVGLPRAALLVSPLVSLDNRVDFAERFLPELHARLRAPLAPQPTELAEWIDQRLAAYGSDPRDLVSAGVADHFRTLTLPPERSRLLHEVFAARSPL
jgi:phosphoglucomutase